MVAEARRAAEVASQATDRRNSELERSRKRAAEVQMRWTVAINAHIPEFLSGAKELGIKPAKRAHAGGPAFYSMWVQPELDAPSNGFWLCVTTNGKWHVAGDNANGGPGREGSLPTHEPPPGTEQQIRECLTRALSARAAGRPEPHTQQWS